MTVIYKTTDKPARIALDHITTIDGPTVLVTLTRQDFEGTETTLWLSVDEARKVAGALNAMADKAETAGMARDASPSDPRATPEKVLPAFWKRWL